MTNRTDQLRELMAAHGKKTADIGKLLDRSPQTVRIWCCKADKRQIPEHSLELLRIKLSEGGQDERL